MDGATISKLLNSNPVTKFTFKGVFSSDTIPLFYTDNPSAFIINTDPSNQPGSHWVAVYKPIYGFSEYFDTSGNEPNIHRILSLLGTEYFFAGKILQYPLSASCGQHCMHYIHQKCLGRTFDSILKEYDFNDTLGNDVFISRKVEKIFHADFNIFDAKLLENQISRALKHTLKNTSWQHMVKGF